MKQVYLKRMTKQDVTKSVTVCTDSIEGFWGLDISSTENYLPIKICNENNIGVFPEGITIHKGYQGEKDWRICGNEFKPLYKESDPQPEDIMCIRKLNDSEFAISIVKKGTQKYDILASFFVGADNYTIVSIEETQNIEETADKPLFLRTNPYRQYITAIKSKPFLLLAGISGTGKSRIVRELARACWDENSDEYTKQKPRNFEMIQVKPNWHDSTELFGYVSRISGKPEFVVGDFLKFITKAWENQDVPHFLCLDEMNLAPVEQYFAEYLSVIESRKGNEDGVLTTDAIFKKVEEEWYFNLTAKLTNNDTIRRQFNQIGITLPQNLIVVGTVNMDETTFSFSRKVLDRAMTIEMNEVDLKAGLDVRYETIGKLGKNELIGTCVEGVDVYKTYQNVCDEVIIYLQKLNDQLEGTPFKIAYRTRNEFLLYVVNNLPYNRDQDGNDIPQEKVIQRALDEITNMKILSRIEGDETKVSKTFLISLENVIKSSLTEISDSISLKKLEEMKKRLDSGYTSFWS